MKGKDGTDAFEDVGHSPDAREMQEKYLIGTIANPVKKNVQVASKDRTENGNF